MTETLMRALVVREYAWPNNMKVESSQVPVLRDQDVLVRVRWAGLNFADTLMIGGTYQERQPLPFVPGAEFCGDVVACGQEVEDWLPGERVMGQLVAGGYGEFAVADPRSLARAPADMPDATAAGFYIPYGTALCALKQRGRLRAGETVLILGAAGAVGQAAVQVGRALGARVIGTARSESRRDLVMGVGADDFVATGNVDPSTLREQFMSHGGFDVVLDTTGGPACSAAMRCLRFEGRLISVGFTSGEVPSFSLNHVLVKNIDLIGCYWGPYQARRHEQTQTAFATLAEWYRTGLIRPAAPREVTLDEVPQALANLTQGKYAGKVVARVFNLEGTNE